MMAIVVNKANGGGPIPNYTAAVDRPLHTHNREVAAEPNGSATPQYVGEIVLDLTNDALWRAVDLTSDGWIALTAPN